MHNISVLILSSADRGGAATIARQDAKSLADLGLIVGYAPCDANLPMHENLHQHWLPYIKASSLVERLLRLTLGQITTLLGIICLVKKYHYQAIINHVPHISKACYFACQICGIINTQVIHLPLSGFKAKKWMKPGEINFSISERGKKDLVGQWGVENNSVYVVPPAIQFIEVFKAEIDSNCQKFNILPERLATACVALFNAQKNHELLINVWEKVVQQEPEAILLLAGDGPLWVVTKKMVSDRNLSQNVRFLGMVTPGWVYERSSFCVLTSKDEGIPLVFLEAAAHKRAFIAFDTEANREFIRSNNNGILIPMDDEQLLVDSIIYLLRQPQLCVELGNHAHKYYLDFCSRVNRGKQLYTILNKITNQK
jgi:glycosyltransferase involved in cell wall biosynthesis